MKIVLSVEFLVARLRLAGKRKMSKRRL